MLYLEPVGGIAGDMFLAAGVDLGILPEQIEQGLSGLKVSGWKLKVQKAKRHEITGTHLDVVLEQAAEHAHRPLSEIQRLIEGADSMPERARRRALEVFRVIGEAEAKIHDVPLEKIHFHEVGAVDSIVDICGAALVLELLGDPEVFAAPPPLGSGSVRVAHGNMPVPAPATLEILRDVPVRFEGVGELTTPTGAALLKALCRIEPPRELVVERVGYGVGTKDFRDRPNVLRASLGRPVHGQGGAFIVEANLDDCSPQLLGGLIDQLLEVGAMDAYVVPVTMKKSRPGHLLQVMTTGERREAVISTLLSESTTLGVRFHRVERFALDRAFVEVQTPHGAVRMKLGLRNGQVLNAHPEYEDCRKLAREKGVPVKQIMAEAVAAYHRKP
ncbi:MAG TPA: nickel pincer cofactor biosynthesis protein LarC [Myxococcaceae bacterium]|nr:nickel pincer cofactor biosynthesis protein LarC [Myxococcaceae bacterium]